jgi:Ricin-type beta-trefoil lectin domain-like
MSMRTRPRRLAAAAGIVLALAISLLAPAKNALAAESLSVNLAATTGPATGVGEGFLYGVSQDGTQPPDQYLEPLGITAFRGGGHVSGGWIGDGYTYGSGTQADVSTVIAQARRLTQAPYHAQYQVILSDIFGADGGQPSNTTYPCTNGNCSDWVTFISDVVGALQATGLPFAYDIWNEPDISVFWPGGAQTTQYYEMWQSAYREIRSIAPNATIVGPDFAYTPQQNQGEWQGFLSNAKSTSTVPNEITNHEEGDGDDPVADSHSIESDIAAAGISPAPLLSANEYQPSDRQTAGVTAWYLARFAQSNYANAMRGNWVCCLTPNLTGVLTDVNGTYEPNGNWWAMRAYADMTGSLVSTTGAGTTAISAAEDSSAKRSVAIIGDENGYTGAASVTYSGLASVPWLASNGSVNVTVDRIPDQYPLSSPQVVYDQNVSVSSGSITVPFTFQASHDAFAIYLTPATSSGGGFPGGYHRLVVANDSLCLDVYGNTTASGAAIDQWTCNAQSNQQFQFVPGSSAYGQLQAQNSGDDITVTGSATASGTPDIVQEPASTSSSSQWLPMQQSDGSWEFENSASGLCLDVYGAGSNLGQQLDQWPCKNAAGTNQDFNAN